MWWSEVEDACGFAAQNENEGEVGVEVGIENQTENSN
jgi:hypothetical protein